MVDKLPTLKQKPFKFKSNAKTFGQHVAEIMCCFPFPKKSDPKYEFYFAVQIAELIDYELKKTKGKFK